MKRQIVSTMYNKQINRLIVRRYREQVDGIDDRKQSSCKLDRNYDKREPRSFFLLCPTVTSLYFLALSTIILRFSFSYRKAPIPFLN